jgi:hypothetical protein
MSTAAPSKQAPAGASSGYEVARAQGQCSVCQTVIGPDQRLMAALLETPTGFQRIDVCPNCWPNHERKDVVAFWQTVMPRPEQKKKLFVDDTVLCELFERLADVQEPAKLNFRFVLGLILMRKRLVIYEDTRRDADREVWVVRMKGRQDHLDLLNPKLDEEQVKDVSQQLNEILHQEL